MSDARRSFGVTPNFYHASAGVDGRDKPGQDAVRRGGCEHPIALEQEKEMRWRPPRVSHQTLTYPENIPISALAPADARARSSGRGARAGAGSIRDGDPRPWTGGASPDRRFSPVHREGESRSVSPGIRKRSRPECENPGFAGPKAPRDVDEKAKPRFGTLRNHAYFFALRPKGVGASRAAPPPPPPRGAGRLGVGG
jgi:hypothetical protein